MSDLPPSGRPETGRRTSGLSERLPTKKAMIGLVIVVLAIWFIVANNTHVRVHLWVVWVSARLWVVLLGTFLAGVLASWLVRRRKIKR